MSTSTNTTEKKAKKATAMPKTVCPITPERFNEKATSVEVEIFGRKVLVEKKVFSTGSYGYFMQGKVPVKIDGVEAIVALQIQAPLVGSKEMSEAQAAAPAVAAVAAAASAEQK